MPRRQNKSCDQCRRSKRRCEVVVDNAGTPTTCRHCQHLRQVCTFHFATQYKASRMRNSSVLPRTPASIPVASPSHIPNDAVEPNMPVPTVGFDWLTPLSPWPSDNFMTMLSNECMSMLDPQGLDAPLDFSMSIDSNTNPDAFQAFLAQCPEESIRPQQQTSRTEGSVPWSSQSPMQHFESSPVAILSSDLTFDDNDQHLSAIYRTMMSGLSKWYLDSKSNALVDTNEYAFQVENHATGTGNKSPLSSPSDGHSTPSPEHTACNPRNATIVGVCRFLDNFGPLFGNILDKKQRDRSNEVMSAVVQAFAQQSVPWSPESAKLYQAYWSRAWAMLEEAKTDQSFILAYAHFLFSVTAVPSSTAHSSSLNVYEELLSRGVLQLQDLESMVEEYLANLSGGSKYRKLFEKSLKVIRWHGFVRESNTSLLEKRKCAMNNLVPIERFSVILPPSFTSQSTDVSRICQYANANELILCRIFNELIFDLSSGSIDVQSAKQRSCAVTDCIEAFNSTYGAWMNQGLTNLHTLPMHHKLPLVSLVLFYNYTVLCVVEAIQRFLPADSGSTVCSTVLKASQYGLAAVGTVTRLARLIKQDPQESVQVEGSDVKLPLLAFHSNVRLVVASLHKTIEGIINNERDSNETQSESTGQPVPLTFEATESVRSLMWCLVSVERTVGGRSVGRRAMSSLLSNYGDLILECWTLDDGPSVDNGS